jgi:uroporphyrinogen decarboxylase
MSATMTSHERYLRAFRHQEADRVPMRDAFWGATLERWRGEGLPAGVSPHEFFGFDDLAYIGVDNSPRFERRVVEEHPDWVIHVTTWGTTQRDWKHKASVPEFLDFAVHDRDSWAVAKARMTATEDRVDWATLQRDYAGWRERGCWIVGGGWFGFDVLHSWFVGTERVLMALLTDPEWVKDMIDTMCDLNLELLEMVWDRGYRFDLLTWPDDLAYVNGPFFSPEVYRKVVWPAHKRACDWAHQRGAFTMLHTDGNVWPLLDDIVAAGVDAIQPLEQKAGMDPIALKQRYGHKLVLEGGIDVRQMSRPEAIEEEIRSKITAAKAGGGYCYHSDHSVPSDVSFGDYCKVIALVRHYGRF